MAAGVTVATRETPPDGWLAEVRVERAGRQHRYEVRVARKDWEALTGGRVSAEALVAASFEFLLEREPPAAILARFDLPVIGRYFPEYPEAMAERFRAAPRKP